MHRCKDRRCCYNKVQLSQTLSQNHLRYNQLQYHHIILQLCCSQTADVVSRIWCTYDRCFGSAGYHLVYHVVAQTKHLDHVRSSSVRVGDRLVRHGFYAHETSVCMPHSHSRARGRCRHEPQSIKGGSGALSMGAAPDQFPRSLGKGQPKQFFFYYKNLFCLFFSRISTGCCRPLCVKPEAVAICCAAGLAAAFAQLRGEPSATGGCKPRHELRGRERRRGEQQRRLRRRERPCGAQLKPGVRGLHQHAHSPGHPDSCCSAPGSAVGLLRGPLGAVS